MKILILKPQNICFGIVDAFANNFGNALTKSGIEVVYYDLKTEPIEHLASHLNEKYSAVIDIYSGLLKVTMGDENQYLWNYMDVPVYQICLDFPVYIMDKMDAVIHKHYALCLDRHYCRVIKECMPHITDSYFFPMAGMEGSQRLPWEERSHDIVFLGSYSNYREWLTQLDQCEEGIKNIGYTFFVTMRDNIQLDQKQAFEKTIKQLNIQLSNAEFYQWLKMIGGIAMSAAAYQREQLIRVLLNAGLKIEVYGDSWKHSPFSQYPGLMIHEQVNESGYISVLEKTKLSLNIMYCNKSGYTERYAYSMLNGAVCISDESEYLCEEFKDGENIAFYKLDELDKLPEKIRWLLDHPVEAQKIADAAYSKAKKEHTWEERAERFLGLMDNQSTC